MRKSIQRSQKTRVTTTNPLPYWVEISEELRRILNSFDIRVFFKTSNTLGSKLVKSKDLIPSEEQANCVYKINRRDCEQVYNGQTSRQLSTRINEHRLASKRQPRNPMELKHLEDCSAIAAHSLFTGYQVNFDDAEIIQRGFDSHKQRFMAECSHITANKNCVNRSSGSVIHPLWQIVMNASR